MNFMFYGCKNLISLNLSNFDTRLVNRMEYMFSGCSKLNILDLSNFNTSLVVDVCGVFNGCSNLNSLDLSNFNTSKVTNMSRMFNGCSNLYSLDLANFNTSKVTNMSRMFNGCSNLHSLNLLNFNTSQVKNMSFMFNQCLKLNPLNLSSFDTSQVIDMTRMFEECRSLSSLILSNFNTSKVEGMNKMFSSCSNLEILDISNFDTSKVTDMINMFYSCLNLYSLDLSNFYTSRVTNMSRMFFNCTKLNSLNLSNFNTSKVIDMNNMFYRCTNLDVLDLSNFNTLLVENMANMFYECSSLSSLNISNFNTISVKNINKMFYGCTNLEYINFKQFYMSSNYQVNNLFDKTSQNLTICSGKNSDFFEEFFKYKKIIFCDDNNVNEYNCYMNNSILYNNYLCEICQNDFLFKYNESNINNSFINCFEPRSIFSTCYNSCKECEIEGNETHNNCIECKDGFFYIFNITNSKYKNCYKNNPFDKLVDEIENKTKKIQNIIENLMNEFNIKNISNQNMSIISYENKKILLTSTIEQKNNEDKNNITMDLGECENILKNEYNISSNDSLYILQIISEEEGMKIPKLEYEVYYPLNNSNDLTKLDLSLCKNTKIEISIKVKINGTLDKYNPKSDYYNDICSKTTSESGTDISLKDRKNEFVNNNMSLCEENCILVDYNYEKEIAKCSCDTKVGISPNYDIKFNKNEFFKSFKDINKILNLKIMKCFKAVFKIKDLKENYGFFIMTSIIIFYFISLIIFVTISNDKLKKEINKIIIALKFNTIPINEAKLKDKPVTIVKKRKKKKKKIIIKTNNIINQTDIKEKILNINKINDNKDDIHSRQNMQINEDNSVNKFSLKSEVIDENKKIFNKILEKNEFELNSLDYEEGRKLDNRNFFEYYISLLKYNHPIMFSFSPFNDYKCSFLYR